MSDTGLRETFASLTEEDLRRRFDAQEYVVDDGFVTTVRLALQLGKPLLVEGLPGSGKTELGKVLAEGFDTELVRLQCYEGLTAENTLYEWNYRKQLIEVQSRAAQADGAEAAAADSVFEESFLQERPLLRALRGDTPVLLIDEIDRADEEFEAFLLEFLSDFQVTIPELGPVSTDDPPVVVITSNRTRGLSDALRRRCLYLHVSPPDEATERAIVRRKVPELEATAAAEAVAAVQELRDLPLLKQPGVAETLDWSRALARVNEHDGLTAETFEDTLGCLLKEAADIERVDAETIDRIIEAVRTEDDSAADEPVQGE